MRNKLKRIKTCRAPGAEVKTSAEWNCSGTPSGRDSPPPAGSYPDAAAASHQEPRRNGCTTHIKIAPVFSRRPQPAEIEGECDVRRHRPVDKPHEAVTPPPPPPPQVDDLQSAKGQHPPSASTVAQRTWEKQFVLSPSSLLSRLEEIQASNPAFPVQSVFSTLQQKTSDTLQDFGPAGETVRHPVDGLYARSHETSPLSFPSQTDNPLCPSCPQNHSKEKRKRGDELSEGSSKRLRRGPPAEVAVGTPRCHLSARGVQEVVVLPATKQPWGNKLRRTRRLEKTCGSSADVPTKSGLNSDWTNDAECDEQSPVLPCRESSFEDVLWTDKYGPQKSSEVIGNCVSINKLHSWLKKWKRRADCEERRYMEERKGEDDSVDSWDGGDFQGEAGTEDDREDPLCNTVLLTGPPGVGKTASVYACAQELGFKVFEVNCSSQRNGRHVLSQLKEATQSHLVEMSGKDSLKPAYLNNYSASGSTSKPETIPGKPAPPKNVISTSKKTAAPKSGRCSRKGKAHPATVTLAHFFKMKAKADHLHLSGPLAFEKPDCGHSSAGRDRTVPRSRKTATSLILFEEVDVIFDSDVGFLGAIKTFMTTTKRPVILTTNDPSFRERFRCSLEEIILKTPSAVNVCSYLQLVCLAESLRLELDDVRGLLALTGGDVRRCLLQLQLWVRSGGGRMTRSGGFSQDSVPLQCSYANGGGSRSDSNLPGGHTSCTASMLGLQSVTQERLLNCLKHWSETDTSELLWLLAESWRGGLPLLYNNLELLLPEEAPSTQYPDKVTHPGPPRELAPSDADRHHLHLNGNVSPKASATKSKSARSISRLSRRKNTATGTSSSALTHKPQRSVLLKGRRPQTPVSSDATEHLSAEAESDRLDALTHFFDLMSYLDVTLPSAPGSRRPETFVWTGAEVKDGLLDEANEEEEGSTRGRERTLTIKAAAEGLGSHRCWWRVSQAWTKTQKPRREMEGRKWEGRAETPLCSAFSKRQGLRFGFEPLCRPSVSERRYKLSRALLGSKPFGLLGNRRAVCVDYLPVLRFVCRFHRVQQQKEEPVGCPNYLRSINLGMSKSTIQLLAEDFSSTKK